MLALLQNVLGLSLLGWDEQLSTIRVQHMPAMLNILKNTWGRNARHGPDHSG